MAPTWARPVDEGLGFESGVLCCVPHPVVPGGALMVVGTAGGAVAVLEAGGKLQPHQAGAQRLLGEPPVGAPH